MSPNIVAFAGSAAFLRTSPSKNSPVISSVVIYTTYFPVLIMISLSAFGFGKLLGDGDPTELSISLSAGIKSFILTKESYVPILPST